MALTKVATRVSNLRCAGEGGGRLWSGSPLHTEHWWAGRYRAAGSGQPSGMAVEVEGEEARVTVHAGRCGRS